MCKKYILIFISTLNIQASKLINFWLKNPIGQQKLYCNNKECIFSWNFVNNHIIKIEYQKKIYTITEKKIEIFNKEKKTHSTLTIKTNTIKLLQTNILKWGKKIEIIKEIEEENTITLFAKYKNEDICIYIKKEPFKIQIIRIGNTMFKII